MVREDPARSRVKLPVGHASQCVLNRFQRHPLRFGNRFHAAMTQRPSHSSGCDPPLPLIQMRENNLEETSQVLVDHSKGTHSPILPTNSTNFRTLAKPSE